jgi:hypothetical protein
MKEEQATSNHPFRSIGALIPSLTIIAQVQERNALYNNGLKWTRLRRAT